MNSKSVNVCQRLCQERFNVLYTKVLNEVSCFLGESQ